MEKTRHSFRHHGHVPPFTAFIQVLPKPGTLQGVAVSLEDVHVVPNPLLDKYCEESCCEAEDEGHEPENVNAHDRWSWTEGGESRGWRQRGGKLWGDGGDLLRDLIEHSDVLPEVKHHLICRVHIQVLLAVDYERGERSRV